MSAECTSCNLREVRTFTTFVNSDQGMFADAAPTAVSNNGQYVLYSFTNFGPIPGATGPLVGGIIYSNNCGVLNPVVTFTPDSGFDNASPITNSQFQRIFLIQETTTNDLLTQLQIKAFNFNNGVLTPSGSSVFLSKSIVNVNLGGNLLAVLTPDSRFLVIVYNGTTNSSTSRGDGFITVFDAQSLAELGTTMVATGTATAEVIISGMINSFSLTSKSGQITDYVALSTGLGTVTPPSNFVVGLTPPFTVKVYAISTGQPVLIDTVNTPQFVNTSAGFQPFGISTSSKYINKIPNFNNCGQNFVTPALNKTLILTTSRAAILPTDNSLAINTGQSASAIPGDNRNLRIYSFNGKRLKLVVAEKFEFGLVGSTFAPDGRTFIVLENNGSPFNIPFQIGAAQIYRICKRNQENNQNEQVQRCNPCTGQFITKYTIEPLGKFTLAGPAAASPIFSSDGHYIFEGFASYAIDQTTGESGRAAFNNVSVLRLSDCITDPFSCGKNQRVNQCCPPFKLLDQ